MKRLFLIILSLEAMTGISFTSFFIDKTKLKNDVGRRKADLILDYVASHNITRMTELLVIKGVGEKTVKILGEKYGVRLNAK